MSKKAKRVLYDQKYLILLSVPFVLWAVIFRYAPLIGWLMAFQDFKLKVGHGFWTTLFTTQFVGFKHFIELVKDDLFHQALINTLAMSGLGLTVGFVMPIIFALLLNEIKSDVIKKPVQSISYLPHFISWVITANLASLMLSSEGPINTMLLNAGFIQQSYPFLGNKSIFWFLITAIDIWKEMGWNAIIFLAAISGVDQALYEAADVDGAGRFRKMWSITLPSISRLITVVLIMNIGWLVSIGFEKQFLLSRDVTREAAITIDYYALNYGIGKGRYSYATAIGLFKSVISVALIFIANKVTSKINDDNRVF